MRRYFFSLFALYTLFGALPLGSIEAEMFSTVATAQELPLPNSSKEATATEPNSVQEESALDFGLSAPDSYKKTFGKMILSLFGLIALIIFSTWALRNISRGKLKQFNYGKTIKIIEKRPLSTKSILYLVEIGGKQVLIGESQLELSTITTIESTQIDEA